MKAMEWVNRMNKYDERYDIRLASINDIDAIMQFINDYWRENHIMSTNRQLFEYEYVDGENVNFVLAIDKSTNLIEGIFGFLRCSYTEDKEKKDIWGSMWKVNADHDNIPLLGIELAKRVRILTGCRCQIGNGANPDTTVLLRKIYFGEKTVKMDQFYYLNAKKEQYNIAVINEKWRPQVKEKKGQILVQRFFSIEEIKERFNVEDVEAIPYKDNWYINKRYFNHPIYNYQVYGLGLCNQEIEALLVVREVTHKGSKVLRIVDYIGNQELFSYLSDTFEKWVQENDYEYIDFFTYGFKEQAIYDAGFRKRTEEDTNIIPNYFEPFLQENIDIWAHYKLDGTLFFKADGDQDRPNMNPQEIEE